MYWIDAYGASMGCDNRGPEDCIITFTGFTLSESSNEEVNTVSTNVTIPPCPGLRECVLTPVSLGDGFKGLTGLRVVAHVAEKSVIWFMDDVKLAWTNNTCAAGIQRARRR